MNYLKLANKDNKLSDWNRPKQLVQAPFAEKGILIDPVVAIKLKELVTDLELENDVVITDGFRSKETQLNLWNETLAEKGELFTNQYVARPGCSEHELGLAIDIGLSAVDNDYIRPSFSEGPVVEKFLGSMSEYGFILRYPENKTEVTHISYEPWHFRYVGAPHSQIMAQQDWVLEEYLHFLETTRSEVNA